MGPWRAAQRFLAELQGMDVLSNVTGLTVDLYGSLAKTGKGHATDMGIQLGLSGEDPSAIDSGRALALLASIAKAASLPLAGQHTIPFSPARDIHYLRDRQLPFHPCALRFRAELAEGTAREAVYYSVGGGFVVREGEEAIAQTDEDAYPVNSAAELLGHCQQQQCLISEIGRRNELHRRSECARNSGRFVADLGGHAAEHLCRLPARRLFARGTAG